MAFALDIQFVKRAEAKLGRKLPLVYVAKMCRENGGGVATGTDYCLADNVITGPPQAFPIAIVENRVQVPASARPAKRFIPAPPSPRHR